MADVVVGHFDEEVVRAHDDPPPQLAEPRARRVRDPLARHRRSRRRLLRGRGSSCSRRGRSGGVRARHGQPPHASRQGGSNHRRGGGWRRWRRTRRGGSGRPRGSRGGCRGDGHRRYRTWRDGSGTDGCWPHAAAARGRALPAPERLLRVPAGASASAFTAAVRLLVPCPAAAPVGLLVPSSAAAADAATALAASPAPSGTTAPTTAARTTRIHAERDGVFPSGGDWKGSTGGETDEQLMSTRSRGDGGVYSQGARPRDVSGCGLRGKGRDARLYPRSLKVGQGKVVPLVTEV